MHKSLMNASTFNGREWATSPSSVSHTTSWNKWIRKAKKPLVFLSSETRTVVATLMSDMSSEHVWIGSASRIRSQLLVYNFIVVFILMFLVPALVFAWKIVCNSSYYWRIVNPTGGLLRACVWVDMDGGECVVSGGNSVNSIVRDFHYYYLILFSNLLTCELSVIPAIII